MELIEGDGEPCLLNSGIGVVQCLRLDGWVDLHVRARAEGFGTGRLLA